MTPREQPQQLFTTLVKGRLSAKFWQGRQETSLWATYPKADTVGLCPS